MDKTPRPINVHDFYHAHIYFDEKTLNEAVELCSIVASKFDVSVGRVHQKCVGPHPMWSCQISFTASHFQSLIPWLDENRKELSVLVHGLTGNDLRDHTDYAYWLGESQPLNLKIFGG
ncbi:4,5-dioxygenase [Alteromonadaceae bacterium M269]|nr:4,5-dioxygenase [Alteromonadaceae bacterium M269]